jgi:Ca2+-binding RTX toxin-like protein
MLRRVGLILATMSLGVIVLSGMALALINCTTTTPCEGTNEPDTLVGNARENFIEGLMGEDYIAGKGARDRLFGGRDNDELHGGGGPDKISGGKHSDSDTLYGENGNDTIIAVDEFSPGWQDYIDCGDGTDTAYVDGYTQNEVDVVVNCENVVPSVCEDVYPSRLCPTSIVTSKMRSTSS